jgi:DNA-binding transcriptional regulator YiaG
MPNVARVLKEETLRLARKQALAATRKLRRDSAFFRRAVADFRRRITALEKAGRVLAAEVAEQRKTAAQPSSTELEKARITGKVIRSARKRLGLSQVDFATLLGVTPVTVWLWERRDGRIRVRGESRSAIVAARKMKKREAAKRVEELKQAARARAGRKRVKRARRGKRG